MSNEKGKEDRRIINVGEAVKKRRVPLSATKEESHRHERGELFKNTHLLVYKGTKAIKATLPRKWMFFTSRKGIWRRFY